MKFLAPSLLYRSIGCLHFFFIVYDILFMFSSANQNSMKNKSHKIKIFSTAVERIITFLLSKLLIIYIYILVPEENMNMHIYIYIIKVEDSMNFLIGEN